jgi:hypothetical protein
MSRLKAKITIAVGLDCGVVYECSIPPDATIKKALKYAVQWLYWKLEKLVIAEYSILQWDYDKHEWLEIAHKQPE